jgi:hypothetical protein
MLGVVRAAAGFPDGLKLRRGGLRGLKRLVLVEQEIVTMGKVSRS